MVIGQRLADRVEVDAEDTPDEAQALDRASQQRLVLASAPDPLDVFAPSPVCDVCRAATLVASGLMASTQDPDEIHARCRTPGACGCGCEYSEGAVCVHCRRLLPMRLLESADGEHAACIDRASCAASMLAEFGGRSEPDKPKPARPERRTTVPRPTRKSAPKSASPRPCTCSCGELTNGGTYRPGHDARHVKRLVTAVREEGTTYEAAVAELPSDALRDKLRKQLGLEEAS